METTGECACLEPLGWLRTAREHRRRLGVVGDGGDHGRVQRTGDFTGAVRLSLADNEHSRLLPVERPALDGVGP